MLNKWVWESHVVRNESDRQKRHLKNKLSCRQVGPTQTDDKYWAARHDLATLPREHSAVTRQHRKLTVLWHHSWHLLHLWPSRRLSPLRPTAKWPAESHGEQGWPRPIRVERRNLSGHIPEKWTVWHIQDPTMPTQDARVPRSKRGKWRGSRCRIIFREKCDFKRYERKGTEFHRGRARGFDEQSSHTYTTRKHLTTRNSDFCQLVKLDSNILTPEWSLRVHVGLNCNEPVPQLEKVHRKHFLTRYPDCI